MLNVKKFMKILLKLVVGISLLVFLSVVVYYFWAISPFPHIKMCRTLESNFWSEPPCRNTRDIFHIIEDRFPIGTTSREEVQSVLHEYFERTRISRSDGYLVDGYQIPTPTLFSAFVDFYYDENELLVVIRFYD